MSGVAVSPATLSSSLSSSSPSPSPHPRRIATPSWLDLRLVLGVALVLASVLIGAKVVSGATKTYPAVATKRDLAAGKILTTGDLQLAQVQLPHRGKGVYLSTLHDAVGRQLNRAVSSGELVPAGAVAGVKEQTTLTVPFVSGAVPDLRTGQRIEVWVSTPSCASVVLLPDVTVQSVHADSSGSFSTGTGGQDVVISVPPAAASRVIAALALDQAQLRAGVLVGARPSASPRAPVRDRQAPLPLPDLAPCSSGAPTR
jgi:hypothetical protein